jgi:molybdopterin-guanine dinucleotide biosynthesis protein A
MGWPAEQTTGVLLAGGRSTRMGGRNKAFAAVGGEPIVGRAVRVLRSVFPEVVIATNDPERYRGFGAVLVGDAFPGRGPLAGLHAAMGVATHPWLFVAACDMPGLDPGAIAFLLERAASDADAVVPCWDGDIEPLHALYAGRTRTVAEACLREGRAAMRDFLPRLAVTWVGEAELAGVSGSAESFLNVNTPEELAAVGGRFEGPDA